MSFKAIRSLNNSEYFKNVARQEFRDLSFVLKESVDAVRRQLERIKFHH